MGRGAVRIVRRGWLGALLGAICVVGGLVPPAAAGATVAADADLSALLRVATAKRHLTAWPEVSVAARERAAARLDAERWALLQREVAGAFEPAALMVRLSNAPDLAGDDVPFVARGFVGSGATGLLGPAEGYPVQTLRAFPEFASRVSAGDVPPTRLLLVGRVDESTGYARNAWRTSAAVARAFARGARVLSCGQTWEAPATAAETGGLRALVQPFRERVRVELLFDARERSGVELQQALRFLESEPSRAFHARLERAIAGVLAEATRKLGERLTAEAARRCVE